MRKTGYILSAVLLLLAANAFSAVPSHISDSVRYTRDSLFIEGLRYKFLKDWDKSRELLLRADSTDGNNAAICYELGDNYMYSDSIDIERSEYYLKKAIALSPDNYHYYRQLILLTNYQKHYDESAKLYEDLLKRFPGNEEDMWDLGILYIYIKEYKKAYKTFERLEKLTGVDSRVILKKCYVLQVQGKYKDALKEFDKLIKEEPLNADYWVYKGDNYLYMGDMVTAYGCYMRSNEINKDNGMLLESLVSYYDRIGESEKAIESLYKIFASPDVPFDSKKDYLRSLIRYYKSKQRKLSDDEADIIYNSIIKAEPDNSNAKLLYVEYLNYAKRTEEAYDLLQSAVYSDPQCKDCWDYLIYYVTQGNDTVKTQQILSDAMDAVPESVDFLYYNGVWQYSKGNEEEAMQYWLKADSLLEINNKASGSDVVVTGLWNTIAQHYYAKKDYDNCFAYFEKCYQYSPDDNMTLNNYAYMLAEADRELDKAAKMSKTTIDREPLNAMFLDTYAYILYKKGDLVHARFYQEQALEYVNKDSVTYVYYDHLGDILDASGDEAKAVECWNKAVEIYKETENKESDTYQENLDALEAKLKKKKK